MLQLDVRTIVVVTLVVSAVVSALSWQLWLQSRKVFSGTDCWGGFFALQSLGLALIAGRGYLSDLWSIVVGNLVLALGLLLARHGMRAFLAGLQRAPLPHWNWTSTALVVLIGAEAAYFTFAQPQVTVRIVAYSGLAALIWLDCAILLLRPQVRAVLRGARVLAFIIGVQGFLNSVRVVHALLQDQGPSDLMGPSNAQALFMVATLAAGLALVAALVLVINQLLLDQANAERDKFRAAFERAPFAVGLTDKQSQKILDANDAFVTLSGYRREELLGHTTTELGMWVNPADRASTIAHFERMVTPTATLVPFRRKSGEVFEALVSFEVVAMSEGPAYIVCLADVSSLRAAHAQLEQHEAELRAMNDELLRFNRAAVGRELDMIRLKGQVNDLSLRLNLPPPYALEFSCDSPAGPAAQMPAQGG